MKTAMKFCAVKVFKAGGQTVMDYFPTQQKTLEWIVKQPKPKDDSWHWAVGEW